MFNIQMTLHVVDLRKTICQWCKRNTLFLCIL